MPSSRFRGATLMPVGMTIIWRRLSSGVTSLTDGDSRSASSQVEKHLMSER